MKKIWVFFLPFLLYSSLAMAAGRSVDYSVGGMTYSGYYTSPAPGSPLILLVHDWDGLTDYELKRSEMLADLGYAVFAIDMFGKDIRPQTTEEKKSITGSLYQNRTKMRELLEGAFNAAAQQGANIHNAVAMGYCFGGTVVLEYARSGKQLKGFVTFHGGLATPEGQDYSQTKGKLLILHGTADKAVAMADFAKLAEQLEDRKVAHEMITYSGAPHAFTVFGSDRYHKDADTKSWQRFIEYLQATL